MRRIHQPNPQKRRTLTYYARRATKVSHLPFSLTFLLTPVRAAGRAAAGSELSRVNVSEQAKFSETLDILFLFTCPVWDYVG